MNIILFECRAKLCWIIYILISAHVCASHFALSFHVHITGFATEISRSVGPIHMWDMTPLHGHDSSAHAYVGHDSSALPFFRMKCVTWHIHHLCLRHIHNVCAMTRRLTWMAVHGLPVDTMSGCAQFLVLFCRSLLKKKPYTNRLLLLKTNNE